MTYNLSRIEDFFIKKIILEKKKTENVNRSKVELKLK